MAFSNMRVVSDGTLATLDISFEYFDRAEISVLFDSVPQPIDSGVWAWGSEANVLFTPAVPAGVEVRVQRKTDASTLRHEFSRGSEFTAGNLDEDLRQILHIVQEATETNLSAEFYDDINMNGNTVLNLRPAVADNEAVSLGDVKARSDTAWAAATQAEASKNLAQAWATSPTDVTPGNASAKTYAGQASASASASAASAGAASTSASAAASSASQAAGSASQASTSASNASTSASQASASASTASTKAAEAAASAAAAALFDPSMYVPQTGPTGYATMPSSTDAAGGVAGLRYNPTKACVEAYIDGKWRALTSRELFQYSWHNGPRNSVPNWCVPADGVILQYSTHPEACAAVWAGKQNAVTEATWQGTPTTRNCWSTGDGSTWVRCPDLNAFVAGTGKAFYLRGGPDALNGTSVGDAIRNITANLGASLGNSSAGGAVYVDSQAPANGATGTTFSYPVRLFDASRVVPTADENRVKTAYGVWIVSVVP